MAKMRSALKLIAISLILTSCAQQAEVSDEQTNPDQDSQAVIAEPEPITLDQLIVDADELIDCSEPSFVSEGEFQSVVCNQGVIRYSETKVLENLLAPWSIWCQPLMAPGSEKSAEILLGENFIIENKNPDSFSSGYADDLCSELSTTEQTALEINTDDSYGMLTNLAVSGLCMGSPEITATTPLRHICSGFGLDEQSFQLWLETGDIAGLVSEYSAECGAGIAGTYGENWLISTYDLDVVVSGERLGNLLNLVSPLPFSSLCEAEETS